MRTIVGIDVSKQSSRIAILVDQAVQEQFKICNDLIGFNELKRHLDQYPSQPEIIYEATGVYSHRLRKFLVSQGYEFSELNPLSAKKEMDKLRPNKNDINDARNLAESQYFLCRERTQEQAPVYKELMRENRYYQQCVSDLVTAKNRLHKALQDTFPEIEQIFSKTDGAQYWKLVDRFPHAHMVQKQSFQQLSEIIQTLGPSRVSVNRAQQISRKLFELSSKSFPAVNIDSHMVYQVCALCRRLTEISAEQSAVIDLMKKQAQKLDEYEVLMSIPGFAQKTVVSLIGELGDLHRFKTPNKINAYIGIDLRFNDSGNYKSNGIITKRGNPYARKILFKAIGNMASAATHGHQSHINDWYQKKKQSNPSKGTKKIAIGAMDRLISTIFHLVLHNQKYDYGIACLARH